jgi:catechol-2,3-dioxygenase
MNITRLNHAVLYVRNAMRSASFYQKALGFRRVIEDEAGAYVFMRAPGSDNHHDLALFSVGEAAGGPTPPRDVGMYHIAWEVPSIAELREARDRLTAADALVGASDHGVNKSLYARDPDGLEFEVMYLVPSAEWGEEEHQAIVRPLDLEAEQQREDTRNDLRQAAR